MTHSSEILAAENISIGYKRGQKIIKTVHKNLSFHLKKGELTCLLGPNGAGKSTLLRTIGASQHPLSGKIFIAKKELIDYSEKELATKIGLVLTDKIFAGGLKVHELVSLGRHPHTGFFGRLSSYDYAIINKAMADTGILDKKDCYMAELSDGEKQKVMIAKALAQESEIIILDEPTSFLDIISRIEIFHLLRKLAHSNNKAILLSTHDLEQALLSSDQLWLLTRQNGIISGNPEDLILSGEVDQLFHHANIHLDKSTGSFRRINQSENLIYITGDPTMVHWVKNLINRYDFEQTDNQISALITIEITAHNSIKYMKAEERFLCKSFQELSSLLRQEIPTIKPHTLLSVK